MFGNFIFSWTDCRILPCFNRLFLFIPLTIIDYPKSFLSWDPYLALETWRGPNPNDWFITLLLLSLLFSSIWNGTFWPLLWKWPSADDVPIFLECCTFTAATGIEALLAYFWLRVGSRTLKSKDWEVASKPAISSLWFLMAEAYLFILLLSFVVTEWWLKALVLTFTRLVFG